ncbi:MAG TPA: hypothetical protein EYN86_01490 [Planctomycetes bacterium]|jgi:hypothetical protein|nr:hypothetical protein [Planctomycetota bacterium]
MKVILLLITVAASVSCAVPTAVGTDFATDQFRFGGRVAVASSSGSGASDGGGFILGDAFGLEAGLFVTDNLEVGAATEFWTYPDSNDATAQLYTGYARYFLQSEGNVRPYVLFGAGLYDADNGAGDVYRLGAGITQFLSDTTSFDLSVEEHFSSYVTDDLTQQIEVDTVNVYMGIHILL